MHEQIAVTVREANTLNQVKDSLFGVFREYRGNGVIRIGYVSGVISSEGKDKIAENIATLSRHTDCLRAQYEFPIFSPTDVFDEALFARIRVEELTQDDWLTFWREVLDTEERYVTHIFMTPRWEISNGAKDEHEVAKKIGMEIIYVGSEV